MDGVFAKCDNDIMRLLATGPRSTDDLLKSMNSNEEPFTKTRLNYRIYTLKKKGMVESRRYGLSGKPGWTALYGLTDKGVEYLVETYGYKKEMINREYPKWGAL